MPSVSQPLPLLHLSGPRSEQTNPPGIPGICLQNAIPPHVVPSPGAQEGWLSEPLVRGGKKGYVVSVTIIYLM